MNKRKIKGIACLGLTCAISLSLGLSQLGFAKDGVGIKNNGGVAFNNVTGQVDLSHIRNANFNTTVMENKKSSYEDKVVIVTLDSESIVERKAGDQTAAEFLSTKTGKNALKSIENIQGDFFANLNANKIEYEVVNTYSTVINAVAIKTNTSHVSEIKKMSGVKGVEISRTYAAPQSIEETTATAYAANGDGGSVVDSAVINKTSVYKTGIYDSSEFAGLYEGEGMVVAVVDTGLDYTHPAFQTQPSNLDALGMKESDVKSILEKENLVAEKRSSGLTADDVFVSNKVPYAYDYADNDADVYPSYSNHGTHVAGIVAGQDSSYTNKDGEVEVDANGDPIPFIGVAPEAQLVIMKTFTDDLYDADIGGARAEDIMAAVEDCVLLNVDVINMSLGTSAGFTTTDDGDEEGTALHRVYSAVQDAGISLIVAASNDYSSGYGGVFGTNLATNPDSGTVGSPSTYNSALSVASISGQQAKYMLANEGTANETAVFYQESSDENSVPYDFAKNMLKDGEKTAEFEYVVVPGIGQVADYTTTVRELVKGRVALVKRGTSTFQEKVEIAMEMGASAIIIYNHVAGSIRMNLGEVKNPIPAVSITMDAGNAMVKGAVSRIGKIKIDTSLLAGPFMSDFSSWGSTPDLKLKPEITAHGGEITSTVPGGYDEQSGTSMASPNMAGVMALVRDYIDDRFPSYTNQEITRLANQLMMSTATTVYNEIGLPYSPRKQGAGLGSLHNVVSSNAYISTDVEENDYRPKIEFGDDKEKKGEYTFSFNVHNMGNKALSFKANTLFMTETLASDELAVAEQAYMLDDIPAVWTVDGNQVSSINVLAGEEVEITVTVKLSDSEKEYIEDSFANGMFVEGFCKLISEDENQCDLVIPFMGFYGDWSSAPMLDYDVYEIAAFQQDASLREEEKPQASVWATQAYAGYYNNKYVIPLGNYVYLLPDSADPMYTDRDHAAISRYNEYTDDVNNYMTAASIRAVYVGLLRNARYAHYDLVNADTGELVTNNTLYRIGKAYSGGGQARPGFIDLDFTADYYDLAANGKYTMNFDFRFNEESEYKEENTFSFDFYVDYEAPVLQDVRIRYYDYKDGNKDKQRIYLDFDVYDNHYAQSLMLCYLDKGTDDVNYIKLATDYITPIRDANKNGTTTVSVEVTDLFYEGYNFYVQIDDYALNHSVFQLDLSTTGAANTGVTPEEFELAEGEEKLTLGVYETHKVSLNFEGNANISNFNWSSNNISVANVRNGEIVGLKPGKARIIVSNGKGLNKTIEVEVVESGKTLPLPSISFGTIETELESIKKAQGVVSVNANQKFTLKVLSDPWYYPVNTLKLKWSSSDESVATVDEFGNVTGIKHGTTIIQAQILDENNNVTGYSTNVMLNVQDEFRVENFILTKYTGADKIVKIPDDMNIMTIGEDAFKDNDFITEVIIPKTVNNIDENAFENCTALKTVRFIQEEEMEVDEAKLTMIEPYAFVGCTSLETLDFRNCKIFTVAHYAFYGCTSLKTILDPQKIGTMHDYAFAGCTSLTSIDISGLHKSGRGVFTGCTSLSTVITDKFTAIGTNMFNGCTALTSITLKTPNIGQSAFQGCYRLSTVNFENPVNEQVEFNIGNRAFYGCSSLKNVNFNNVTVNSIGQEAFGSTGLTSFTFPKGLTSLGSNILNGSSVNEIVLNDNIDLASLQSLGNVFGRISVSVAQGSTKYSVINGSIYNAAGTKLLKVLSVPQQGFTFPQGVTAIAPYAFVGSNVTSITIPASITSIGEYAFQNTPLSSVTFEQGSSLTVIEPYTFSGTRLSSVVVPASVTELGNNAFANTPLTAISFTGNTLGNSVFANCTSLTEITLYDGITTMGSNTFSGCIALTSVVMPSVQVLGSNTFQNANSLKTVTFGQNATTIGTSTFTSLRSLTNVTLGDGIEQIGSRAFYNCTNLETINLKNVKSVGNNAFYGCAKLATVTGIENLTTIGDYAFYNCTAIEELNLESAKTIGAMAFGSDSAISATKGYTSINMPVVEEIGDYAFLNGKEEEVVLPATVKQIGYGAFSASQNLINITVSEDNACYFDEDGVLYKYIKIGANAYDKNSYELVAYPSAKEAEEVEGKLVYEILEKTVSVKAASFSNLQKGVIDRVVLPYSVKTLGDEAFFASGITEYEFECMTAPVLETSNRPEIMDAITQAGGDYRGFYYMNFNEEFIYFSDFGGFTSELKIFYPENATGYDNYIWNAYFGEKVTTGIHMEDRTRETIQLIESLQSVDEVKSWISLPVNDENKAMVQAFSDNVKIARAYLDGIKDAEQTKYINSSIGEKLSAIENELRAVKARFGIVVRISYLKYDSSNCKTVYNEGETFDMTGLKITIVYDDGSTELADMSKFTLETTRELTTYDNEVEISGYGTYCTISITVNEPGAGSQQTPPSQGNSSGCNNSSNALVGVISTLVIIMAIIVVNKRRNARG